jgi:integrase
LKKGLQPVWWRLGAAGRIVVNVMDGVPVHLQLWTGGVGTKVVVPVIVAAGEDLLETIVVRNLVRLPEAKLIPREIAELDPALALLRHLGNPTVNVSATALRFFFKVTLKRRDLADAVVSVREPRRLPVVLSPEEVGRLLALATNIKHKAALSLTYATGLRSSEVVSLKLSDIDKDRMVIRVEQGKGKKDRYVILSPTLLELLRGWWRVARKKGVLPVRVYGRLSCWAQATVSGLRHRACGRSRQAHLRARARIRVSRKGGAGADNKVSPL